jgi:hypothetical protein
VVIPAQPETSSSRTLWEQLVWRSAPLRGAVVAGALCGLISAGIGSRVVMRIITLLNEDRDGVMTDASATVGDVSLSGTLGLLLLGTVFGVLGGLLYLGVRRWLWVPKAWRGLAFGVLTMVTVGQPLFDPANVDFQIFEPVLVVLGLFAMLFLVNGLLLAPLMGRIHPEPTYAESSRVPKIAGVVLALAALAGLAVTAGTLQTMVDDAGTCFSAAGGGEGCAVLTSDVAGE